MKTRSTKHHSIQILFIVGLIWGFCVSSGLGGKFEDYVRNDVVEKWIGTPYDFYGCPKDPQNGGIACGHFVGRVMEEVGMPYSSIKMGQQPAENIIKNLCSPETISRFSDVPYSKFKEAVISNGEGMYIVGLDCHVGFLHVHKRDVSFIHSGPSAGVVAESPPTSSLLTQSRYRVIGRLDKAYLKTLPSEMPYVYGR